MIPFGAGKRILDVVTALVLAVLFLPFWLIIPLMIFTEDLISYLKGKGGFGQILYTQPRVGKNSRPFKILKFRSMIADADDLLWKDPKYQNLREEYKKQDWKLENDPRVTRVGRLLRKLSIDEFPQVFNVLAGDMSVVGPRAYRPHELVIQQKKYPETKKLIEIALRAKPGITGLWQVSGRNDVPFDKRISIDAEYAKRRSLTEDLWILIKTPKAMLSKW